MNKVVYCGFAIDDLNQLIERERRPTSYFAVSEVGVLRYDGKIIKLENLVPIDENKSADLLTKSELDTPIFVGNGFVFYSFDKEKCTEFVSKKYEEYKTQIHEYTVTLEELSNCQIDGVG